MSLMKLTDFLGRSIELSESTLDHIKESHPEISIEEIAQVLLWPLEVRENAKQNFVELFYQRKIHAGGKLRYRLVIVKRLREGNFISSAMTTSSMKSGKTLFKKDKE